MDTGLFYSRSLKGRLKLLKRNGGFITRIRYYGFYLELYEMEGDYFEVYYNRYTHKLDEVEVLDHKDERLHQFAAYVDLSDLFGNSKSSK